MLYRPQNPSAPYLNLTLEAKGTTSFTEELALPAGPYLLEIATENEHGAGGKSARTEQAFTVGEAPSRLVGCVTIVQIGLWCSVLCVRCALHASPPLLHAHGGWHPGAGVSSSPTIVGLTGDASGATLDVMRPGNMSDDAVATYLIQAYADAEGSTKVGRGMIAMLFVFAQGLAQVRC